MSVAFVLLAAGEGSRWDGTGHKLLAPLNGSTVFELALTHAAQGLCDEVVVVQGALDLSEVVGTRAVVLTNSQWRAGQGSSLETAITHCRAICHTAMVVALADQPFIVTEAWNRLAVPRERPIGVAVYNGRRGHPIRLDATTWSMIDTSSDEGARALLRDRPDLVEQVPCPGNPADIDTMGDLLTWSSSTNSP